MSITFEEFYETIEIGDIKAVKEIILERPELLMGKDRYGFTVIHAISSTDDEELAELILRTNLDVNCKNDEGITPLHTVLYPEIAQLLIDYGANVNINDNCGNTPLHIHASDGGDTFDVIEVLLENGADKTRINDKGKTAYDIAKNRKDQENASILML